MCATVQLCRDSLKQLMRITSYGDWVQLACDTDMIAFYRPLKRANLGLYLGGCISINNQ